jgi:hypothetical protein
MHRAEACLELAERLHPAKIYRKNNIFPPGNKNGSLIPIAYTWITNFRLCWGQFDLQFSI